MSEPFTDQINFSVVVEAPESVLEAADGVRYSPMSAVGLRCSPTWRQMCPVRVRKVPENFIVAGSFQRLDLV